MRKGLVEEQRRQFLLDVLEILRGFGAAAFVVVSDETSRLATRGAATVEADVVNLILERIGHYLRNCESDGVVIADRPGGGRPDEEKFLLGCLEMTQAGAGYIVPGRIGINVLSAPSKFIRLLQAADLIVSCTLARIAGERTHAPPIFDRILPLFPREKDRCGGVGVKIHPDFKYANLYHWLLKDEYFVRMNVGVPLPFKDRPFAQNADEYRTRQK